MSVFVLKSALLSGSTLVVHRPVSLAKEPPMLRRKRARVLVLAIGMAGMMLGQVQLAQAQLSKGYQILLNRGLQLQGLVQWADYFHLDTYSNANYTSINWGWGSVPDSMDATTGEPWSPRVRRMV